MPLIRRSGVLYYEKEKPDKIKAPVTTPVGVKEAGGTSKQADMAGTKLQKEPVLQQQVQRQFPKAPTTREATEQEQQARVKASQLEKLKGLQPLISERVKGQLKGISLPKELQLAEGIEEDVKNIVTQDIPDEQKLVQLANLYNGDYSKAAQALTSAFQQVEPTIQEQMMTALGQVPMSVSSFEGDLQQLGFGGGVEELAEVIGIDSTTLGDMSINELQDTIEQQKFNTYNQIDSLKSQIEMLPPGSAQREPLERELEDLAGVGIVGLEASVSETVEQIAEADKITIGGEDYDIEELLVDDEMSNMISMYLQGDTSALSEDDPILGEIAKHVDEHKEFYKKALEIKAEEAQGFVSTQQGWDDFVQKHGSEFLAKFGIDTSKDTVTEKELQASKQKLLDLDSENIFQYIMGDNWEEEYNQIQQWAKKGNTKAQDALKQYQSIIDTIDKGSDLQQKTYMSTLASRISELKDSMTFDEIGAQKEEDDKKMDSYTFEEVADTVLANTGKTWKDIMARARKYQLHNEGALFELGDIKKDWLTLSADQKRERIPTLLNDLFSIDNRNDEEEIKKKVYKNVKEDYRNTFHVDNMDLMAPYSGEWTESIVYLEQKTLNELIAEAKEFEANIAKNTDPIRKEIENKYLKEIKTRLETVILERERINLENEAKKKAARAAVKVRRIKGKV